MKKIISVFSFLIIIVILAMPSQLIKCACGGIDIWLNSVVPSLFPFMVCANMLIYCQTAQYLGTVFSIVLTPFLRLSADSCFALISGLLCGYPVGAAITEELYQKGIISAKDAKISAVAGMNAGPAFIINAVGVSMIKNAKSGYIILFSSILSNFIIGFLLSRMSLKQKNMKTVFACENEKMSVPRILSKSISKAISTVLQLGGYIIFFSVFTEILNISNSYSLISFILPFKKEVSVSILTGMTEMTCGLKKLNSLGIYTIYKTALSAFLLSFGGLCVHFQAFEFLKNIEGLSFLRYVMCRFFSAVICGFITFALCYLII